MARKTQRGKKGKRDQLNHLVAAGFIVFVIGSMSIYFRPVTGWLGEKVGNFFFAGFSVLSYALPLLVLAFATAIFSGRFQGKLRRTLCYVLALFLLVGALLASMDLPNGKFWTVMSLAAQRGKVMRGGGVVGGLLAFGLVRFIGTIGIILLIAFVLFFFILHLFDIKMVDFLRYLGGWTSSGWQKTRETTSRLKERARERRAQQEKRPTRSGRNEKRVQEEVPSQALPVVTDHADALVDDALSSFEPWTDAHETVPVTTGGLTLREAPKEEPSPAPQGSDEADEVSFDDALAGDGGEATYITPPIELLESKPSDRRMDSEGLRKLANVIEQTLRSFGIESQVVSIMRGPTVTQFELKPQAGVKVSRITNLADDLALALAAQEIRIEAPIPGKPYVGIEVPNTKADTVWLRDILQSDAFVTTTKGIPVALGESIEGKPVIAQIAKMPHLLIAGATGAGKSVCINTIIMSILYKYSPAEVRLILVDPKVVELSVYNEIPHLMIPVVTDPKKAAKALYTLVKEMERRFKLFSQYAVRDIGGYREQRTLDPSMENLPYIVLIIDELSDLMMVASKDVESHITRLAQMARACGIHLIIATQRPSVDVITGTIKANIPSRISFAVSSSIDSRTILDQTGAEKLLGKGDMLYYPASMSKPQRIQGAFVSDAEVRRVVDYLTEKHEVHYDRDLIENLEEERTVECQDDGTRDALMDEVLEFISHEETTSISGLQRRFRIGYARAGRLIDELEAMGAISPQDGSKPRQVFVRPGQEWGGSDESGQ
ncbi:MAG: DNA translocase FtsK [Peptoniphilaceae bacterium]|nr:DNA translocase FtsK [Peptoniphilaceae bacterium]MDY6085535.1 DNA translocase FtsK [Peptoniphilaceae bacterium]